MDVKHFEAVVRSFADREGDVTRSGNRLLADIHDEQVEVELSNRQGVLWVTEDGRDYTAWRWIVERLGRFDVLARRILDAIPSDPLYIPAEADVVDVLDRNPEGGRIHVESAPEATHALLDQDLAGTSKVVYLTSDAGEGKTTLIEQLTRYQAEQYLAGETSWLMLPVQLGGRTLLSLDDVIIGTLANRLRFRHYYYTSVLELARLGAIVIALDGFEEMFVETRTGEAVSSLGKLLTQFDSQGRLLVAARSAYYRFNDFEAQAKLFQSLRDASVSFAEVNLCRWRRSQFIQFGREAGLDGATEHLYDTIAARLGDEGPKHPLLTRAVLARKLVEEAVKSEDQEEMIIHLTSATGEQYFDEFISRLIVREANEKWIYRDRDSGPARPLLTTDQHHALLTAVADEMWRSGVDALSMDVLEVVGEITIVDGLHLPNEVAIQTRIRLPQHALLQSDDASKVYRFDHEEFKNYYLGRQLADLLGTGSKAALRAFLDTRPLPEITVRVGAARLLREYGASGADIARWIGALCEVGQNSRRTSYVRSGAGQVALALLSTTVRTETVEVRGLYFRAPHTAGLQLESIRFIECVFERFHFVPSHHSRLEFQECDVMAFTFSASTTHADATFDLQSRPTEICIITDDDPEETEARRDYAPASIATRMASAGFNLGSDEPLIEAQAPLTDPEMVLVDRLLRIFQRSTHTSEDILQTNFGRSWPQVRDLLDDLVQAGLLRLVPHRGSGNHQGRYRLGRTFLEIEQARRISDGVYERFLEAMP